MKPRLVLEGNRFHYWTYASLKGTLETLVPMFQEEHLASKHHLNEFQEVRGPSSEWQAFSAEACSWSLHDPVKMGS